MKQFIQKIRLSDIIAATFLSILIFSFITVLTYFRHLEHHSKFDAGFPWIFYYQFPVDCEIQSGGYLLYLILDCTVTWIAVVVAWILYKRK